MQLPFVQNVPYYTKHLFDIQTLINLAAFKMLGIMKAMKIWSNSMYLSHNTKLHSSLWKSCSDKKKSFWKSDKYIVVVAILHVHVDVYNVHF